MKHVIDIMTIEPACCTPDTRLPEVAKLMLKNDCGEIPVIDNEETRKPVGVITDRDIVCRSIAVDNNPLEIPVSEVMSSPALTVPFNMRTEECCHFMAKHGVRRILVVDKDGQLYGIVSQADLARFLTVEQKVEFFERISSPREPSTRNAA